MMMNHAGCYAQHEGFLFFQKLAWKGLISRKSASKVQVWKTKRPSKMLIYNQMEGLFQYSRRDYYKDFHLHLNKNYMR